MGDDNFISDDEEHMEARRNLQWERLHHIENDEPELLSTIYKKGERKRNKKKTRRKVVATAQERPTSTFVNNVKKENDSYNTEYY